MRMRKEKILEDLAIEEAKNLKNLAKPEEINNLNPASFDPTDPARCIYGQMTGSCWSDRANELIIKCCTKVTHWIDVDVFSYEINGKATNKRHGPKEADETSEYYSPIETLIFEEDVYDFEDTFYSKRIMAFLKDETKELSFD